MDRKKSKNYGIFAYFHWWANGPYSPYMRYLACMLQPYHLWSKIAVRNRSCNLCGLPSNAMAGKTDKLILDNLITGKETLWGISGFGARKFILDMHVGDMAFLPFHGAA